MALQAMLDNGDEVLVPAPDYPLWTGVDLARRRPAGALPVRRVRRLAARPRRPRREDHRPDQGDRRHQPEQPDRRGVPAADARGDRRPGPAARARRAGRRDLRQDPLRRRGPPHHRASRRTCSADVQRTVEGVPAGRFPVGLADGHRAHATRRELPRRPRRSWPTCGSCANVPAQHAIQTALGGRQSINGPGAAGWSVARAARRRVDGARTRSRRHLRPSEGRAVRLSAAGPGGVPDQDDEQLRAGTAARQKHAGRAGQRLQLARTRTTSASSPCRGSKTSKTPWPASPASWRPTSSSSR